MFFYRLFGLVALPLILAHPTGGVRPLLPPLKEVRPKSACVAAGKLIAVTRQGELAVRDLRAGSLNLLPGPEPVAAVACAQDGGFWALSAVDYGVLFRFDNDGKVKAKHRLPMLAQTLASDGPTLLVAQTVMTGGETLLWRGPGHQLKPWALPARALEHLPPHLRGLANSVEVSAAEGRVAVIFWFGASEVLLFRSDGSFQKVALPYFGHRRVPENTPLTGPDFQSWPRPYAHLVATQRGVFCLSGPEGDVGEGSQRGRHVVEVSWDGVVGRTWTLEVDGFRLVRDEDQRVLVVDRHLGVWQLDLERKGQ